MTQRPGDLPADARAELDRASQIPDRAKRLAAIDRARERAALTHPHLFKETNRMQVKLKNARLAFPNLFVAKAFKTGDKVDFNGSFIIPKDHPQLGEIHEAMKTVAKERWGSKVKEIYALIEKQDRLALHDGDTKMSTEGYAGNLFINARNKTKPTIVDRSRRELTEADGKPYAGCYVNVILEFWAQDNDYGKRINASLGGVQFIADGDAFSGGRPANADDFDDIGADGETADAGGEGW